MNYKYILVTCCKNEGKNLPKLINSIVLQTAKPVLWVITDDGSTDNTSLVIEEARDKYRWIQSIKSNSNKRDLGLHLAGIMKSSFDYAVLYCKEKELEYNYLGNVDGDLTLEQRFFENLITEFDKNPNLGIASGGTKHIIINQVVHAKISNDEPSGGHMLIRRKCFEACGGIPISYAMDSVLKAKARLRGWMTKRFEENIATEIRDVGSAEGYWKGFLHRGRASYYLNLNPLHIGARTILYSLEKPYYGGIALLVGYLRSFIGKERQINDEEIRHYFWNKWKEHLHFNNFGVFK